MDKTIYGLRLSRWALHYTELNSVNSTGHKFYRKTLHEVQVNRETDLHLKNRAAHGIWFQIEMLVVSHSLSRSYEGIT
jgi:hypothetical protein